MGAKFDSAVACEMALDKAVDSAMNGAVTERAVSIVQTVIERTVYNSYEPKFLNRTYALMDRGNFITMYPYHDRNTLGIIPDADWNNIGFIRVDDSGTYDRLPEAIAFKNIYNAPPRDFYGKSEDELESQVGSLEKALTSALHSMGF